MKIKFTSIMRSGIDYGTTYDITGSYEGFLLFVDEFGRQNSVHTMYEGKLYEVVK